MKKWIEDSVGPEEIPAQLEPEPPKPEPTTGDFLDATVDAVTSQNDQTAPDVNVDKTADTKTIVEPIKEPVIAQETKTSSLGDCSHESLQYVYDQYLYTVSQKEAHDKELSSIKEKLCGMAGSTAGSSIVRDLIFFSFGLFIGVGLFIAYKKVIAVNHLYKD